MRNIIQHQPIPSPMGKTYLPYQEKGIRYALGARGTLIADEMGLGKTVQAIGVINATQAMLILIVCPAGLRLNWKNELDDWLMPVPGQEVRVVSYHQAESVPEFITWDLVIIDEVHYCKNPESQRSQLMARLSKNAKRIIALTGTPMENCPIEIWPILKMVCPERWDPPNARIGVLSAEQRKSHPGEGPNFWAFAKRYCNLHKRSFQIGRRFKQAYDFSGASNLDELQGRLRATCMVRRLKQDVLTELPEKRRQLIVFPSNTDDSGIFPELNEDNYFDVLRRLKADKVAFAAFSRRRHEQALAKVDMALRFIGDLLDETRKLIVFAHHADVIAKLHMGIEEEFVDRNDYSVVVTGKTHVADRGAAVHAFQTDPQCRVFIGSIGAAGVGITLTAASHVVFVELDPVPGRMTQAEDRAHRITQRDMVLVQHLLSNNSLCARMAKILVRKQEVISRALDTHRHEDFSELESQDWTSPECFT